MPTKLTPTARLAPRPSRPRAEPLRPAVRTLDSALEPMHPDAGYDHERDLEFELDAPPTPRAASTVSDVAPRASRSHHVIHEPAPWSTTGAANHQHPAPSSISAFVRVASGSRMPDSTMTPLPAIYTARMQRIALVALTCAAFVAAAWIASALWAGLFVGVLVAFALEPAYRRIVARFPTRGRLAAIVTVIGVALVSLGSLALVAYIVVQQLADLLPTLQRDVAQFMSKPMFSKSTEARLSSVGITPAMVSQRVGMLTDAAAGWLSSVASGLVGALVHALAGLLIALVTAFYALKDRRPLERRLEEVLPLPPRVTRELATEFRKVGRGTFIGSLLAGLVQGVLAGVGFALCGVPQAPLLGVVTAIASFIPVVGTMVVWVPVGVAYIAMGRPVAGVFELLWGIVVTTSFVDYVLRPKLVGKESRSHPLLFLVGLIGGVEVLGAVGILAGPIVMALFAAVVRVYRREVVQPLRDAPTAI